MAPILVVVEAPKKVKIIQNLLNGLHDGREYLVMATSGHLLDLAKKGPHGSLGLDINNHFEPYYVVLPSKTKVISDLRRAARSAQAVWIASDLDHEGEFIGASICHAECLNLPLATTPRLLFNEITAEALQKAIAAPQRLNPRFLDAQKCRRILDRLIGFELSAAARQINNNLVMGRVKTVMVKLVAESEALREAHVAETYYRGKGNFSPAPVPATSPPSSASVAALAPVQWTATAHTPEPLTDLSLLQRWLAALQALPASQQAFRLLKLHDRNATESPPPPFQTSSLQKIGSRHFGTSPKAIMSAAQALYERGLISYPRTDTVHLPASKIEQLKARILQDYGPEYYQERHFRSGPHSQEAHSAIYPTDLSRPLHSSSAGEFAASSLESRLYRLIYQRTLACQMAPARKRRLTLTLQPPPVTTITDKAHADSLQALTYQIEKVMILWPGFLQVYGLRADSELETTDNPEAEAIATAGATTTDTSGEQLLALREGDLLWPQQLQFFQDWTHPPPRCDEVRLLDQLERNAIGRPSTWAPLLAQVLDREYLCRDDRPGERRVRQTLTLDLYPPPSTSQALHIATESVTIGAERAKLYLTDLGRLMVKFAEQFFPMLFNLHFTAELEKRLDLIDEGQVIWWQVVNDVYQLYRPVLDNYRQQHLAQTFRQKRLLGPSPQDGRPVYSYVARYGAVVQIGADDDKQKRYYPLIPPMTVETVTMEDLPRLTLLPLTLGPDPVSGAIATVKNGPYGLYFQVQGNNYTLHADCFHPPLPAYTKPTQYRHYIEHLQLPALLAAAQLQEQAKAPVASYGPYHIRRTRSGKSHYLAHEGQIVTISAPLLEALASDPTPLTTLQALLADPPVFRGRRGRAKPKPKAKPKAKAKATTKVAKPKPAPKEPKKAPAPKKLSITIQPKGVKPLITLQPKKALAERPLITLIPKSHVLSVPISVPIPTTS